MYLLRNKNPLYRLHRRRQYNCMKGNKIIPFVQYVSLYTPKIKSQSLNLIKILTSLYFLLVCILTTL